MAELGRIKPDNFVSDLVIRKLGHEIANAVNEANLKVAESVSEKMIEELNLQGAGYAENHGK